MRMPDVIAKKKNGKRLTNEEIDFVVRGYVAGEIPDYQMSAFLMAVCFCGMTRPEVSHLTKAMAASGDQVDLRMIPGFKADKHSTGGVGDKTTLIVAPLVASLGVKVAKMSGRGLGHTGGTIDKLESIPGFSTALSTDRFLEQVRDIGIAIAGQTGNLVPADKKMYALRDVTSTVDSIPLIASSIMSKKLAAGSNGIVLDVKCGSGAFMKDRASAKELARVMVDIGKAAGRKVAALVTDMDVPLGNAVGNSLEVLEALETLSGRGPEDLRTLCLELAAHMLSLAGQGSVDVCRSRAEEALDQGTALDTFGKLIAAQGGDASVIRDPKLLPVAKCSAELISDVSGYVSHMDTESVGIAASLLGAGRMTKEDVIDLGAGLVLRKKTGDRVEKGETLAVLYASETGERMEAALERLRKAYHFSDKAPKKHKLIYDSVQ
ncbi:MAG: pyrimidine-nucleoside phosphorylase [Lachnospiraceae bacterium]|nr:pyrimidine-nucleoside phosphorylase [Lachnospiraceae bacterium]